MIRTGRQSTWMIKSNYHVFDISLFSFGDSLNNICQDICAWNRTSSGMMIKFDDAFGLLFITSHCPFPVSSTWGDAAKTQSTRYSTEIVNCIQTRICRIKGISSRMRKMLFTQSFPTLYDPMDCNPLGFSVPGILQERILEWVAISFSNPQGYEGNFEHLHKQHNPF